MQKKTYHRSALIIAALLFVSWARGQTLERIVGSLEQPTDIQHAGDGSQRLFVVQQNGLIRILADGKLLPAPFLDIRGRTKAQGEQGLLGLAFPPDYPARRHCFVNYTNRNGDTVVARYRLSGDPNVADPASETILLTVAQPFGNHNGGQLRFGPDGYLYVGMGDGGSGGDPRNNGQNPNSLLGKILRIDAETDLGQYRIPPDNPFVNQPGFRPEIWALGLRNPWRFSFDRVTGDLWIGDVGQNRFEEIDFQPTASPGGENYGWRKMEGFGCFEAGCSPDGLTLPVHAYPRTEGVSVTGGFVYRGSRYPAARGAYVYGDFGTGRIWTLRRAGGRWRNQLLVESGRSISAFGEDEAGELYLADYGGGAIYRLGLEDVTGQLTVVNGASFREGLTPGSAATAFLPGILDAEGVAAATTIPLPTELEGIQVLVDGIEAPLYAVANTDGTEQANFQTPFEVAGRPQVTVTVRRKGLFETDAVVPVSAVQPGVFTRDGRAAIVVHHATNQLAGAANPLIRGEFAYLYATGLGPVENSPGTGQPGPFELLATTMSLPALTIGGLACDVLFAGLAPGFVGVYQVNFRIVEGVVSGEAELVVDQQGVFGPPVIVFIH